MNWPGYPWNSTTTGTWASSGVNMASVQWVRPMPQPQSEPIVCGHGPIEASTCTELSVRPAFIHDVNGYYRELGVLPWATRKDLRLAYFERGGQESVRLTYIIKQLLNPAVRDEYDNWPLHQGPYPDQYVLDAIRKEAEARSQEKASQMRAQGIDLDDEEVLRKVYESMGIDTEDVRDTPDETLDPEPPVEQDQASPAETPFSFAYYLWRTMRADSKTAQTWQECLVRAFRKRGIRTRFAVGLQGGMAHPWVQANIADRLVFLLHHQQTPTDLLAEKAVDQWLRDQPEPLRTER